MQLDALKELIPFLRSQGVQSFKSGDTAFTFQPGSAPSEIVEVPEPANMPADLRSDTLMNADKVLHWSDNSSNGDESLPLTDEVDL